MQHLLPTPRLRGIPLYLPRQEGSDTFWGQNSVKVRLRARQRCVTWKPFALVKIFFFFPLPVQNKWVWSLRTVSAIDFFIKQTFWLVIVRVVWVMMFSFHWSFPANHDREPAGTMARSTKKRKGKKAMRTAAMPVSFIGHTFFYLSEVLWMSGAGNVKRYFELFLL